MNRLRILILATLILASMSSSPVLAQQFSAQNNTFPFAASDCLGYRLAKVGDYSAYKVRLVTWGGAPDSTPSSIAKFKAHLRDGAKIKTSIAVKVGTRTEYKGFIDSNPAQVVEARAINLQGVPYLVPDADKNSIYKGYGPFWFCTNNDAFKRYLQSKLAISVDPLILGLTIDDPEGSSVLTLNREGCYCTACVTKFGKYLQRAFSPLQLSSMGISNPAIFDIKQLHLRYSGVPISKRPLYKEYESFQLEGMVSFINEMMADYKSKSKKHIIRAANIAPYSWLAFHLRDSLDYFTSEIGEGASGGALNSPLPVMAFKLADAYRKPGAFMATGEDNFILKRDGRPTLLGAWIAEAYANGHYFMAPIEYFYYSKQLGRGGFFNPSNQDRHQALYAFIKKNAVLFDSLSSAAFVCVAISPEVIRLDRKQIEETVRNLSASNIPFDIVFPEFYGQEAKTGKEGNKAYTHVLFLDNGKYTEQEKSKFTSRLAPRVTVIKSSGEAAFLQIAHTGSGQLSIVPRSNSARLVLHVLNRAYIQASDSLAPTGPVNVTVPAIYFGGKAPKTVTYVMAPVGGAKSSSQGSVSIKATRQGYTFSLPPVPFWCIVEVIFS